MKEYYTTCCIVHFVALSSLLRNFHMTSVLFRVILFSKHIFQYSITYLVVITKTIAIIPAGVKRNHAFISKNYEQSRSFVPEALSPV